MPEHYPYFLHLLLFIHLSLPILASQNVTCYFPTGDAIAPDSSPNDYYQACPTSLGGDNFRMCCKTDGSFNDVCEPNGLCSRQHDPGLGEDQGLLRSTCTDPSWSSPSCLNLCTTGMDLLGNKANDTEQYVRPCSDGSFCCEAETPNLNATLNATVSTCCSQGQGLFIQSDGKVSDVNPSGTPTPTASATPSPTPTPSPKSNTGAIVGGVVGGVLGLAVVAGALWFFLRSRKRKMRRREEEVTMLPREEPVAAFNGVKMSEMGQPEEKMPMEAGGNETFEMDGDLMAGKHSSPYELR